MGVQIGWTYYSFGIFQDVKPLSNVVEYLREMGMFGLTISLNSLPSTILPLIFSTIALDKVKMPGKPTVSVIDVDSK